MADILLTIFESRGAAALSSTLSSLSGGFLDLETRAGRMATLGAGLSGTALGLRAINDSAKAAGNEAAAASVQLDAMLRARGETSARANLDALAARMSDLTGKDDDLFTTAEVRLLSFGLTSQQIAAIMPGIEGQAETMGQSLEGAAESFGRAFASGNVGALTRTGVVLSTADKEAIKLAKSTSEAAGQQELFNRVLASYEHFAVGAGGGISEAEKAQGRWNTQMGNAQELFGQGVGEAQIGIYDRLGTVLKGLNEQHPALIKGLGEISAYAQLGASVAGPLLTGAGAYMKYRDSVNLAKLAKEGLHATTLLESASEVAKTGIAGKEASAIAGTGAAAFEAQRAKAALGAGLVGGWTPGAGAGFLGGEGAAAGGSAAIAGVLAPLLVAAAVGLAVKLAVDNLYSKKLEGAAENVEGSPMEGTGLTGTSAAALRSQADDLARRKQLAAVSGDDATAESLRLSEINTRRRMRGAQGRETANPYGVGAGGNAGFEAWARSQGASEFGGSASIAMQNGRRVVEFRHTVTLPPTGTERQSQRDSNDLDDETAP